MEKGEERGENGEGSVGELRPTRARPTGEAAMESRPTLTAAIGSRSRGRGLRAKEGTLKHGNHEEARNPRNARHPFRALRFPSCHSCFKRPSTTPISSSANAYSSYSSATNLRVQLPDLGTPRKPLFLPSAPLILLLSFDVTV
jgi:hypothetical protein